MRPTPKVVPVLFVALAAVSCGGANKVANLKPGPLPPHAGYVGTWFSPQYGKMVITQNGNRVAATYTKDEREGRLEGRVNGDLLIFDWTEERELIVGRPSQVHGKGYFRYVIGEDGKHYLVGEWGLDNDYTGGGPWRAYRQSRETSADDHKGSEGGDPMLEDVSLDGYTNPDPEPVAEQDEAMMVFEAP